MLKIFLINGFNLERLSGVADCDFCRLNLCFLLHSPTICNSRKCFMKGYLNFYFLLSVLLLPQFQSTDNEILEHDI